MQPSTVDRMGNWEKFLCVVLEEQQCLQAFCVLFNGIQLWSEELQHLRFCLQMLGHCFRHLWSQQNQSCKSVVSKIKACAGKPTPQLIPWCSGYHVSLTHSRSPVRSRAESLAFFFFSLSSLSHRTHFYYKSHLIVAHSLIQTESETWIRGDILIVEGNITSIVQFPACKEPAQ